MAGDNPHACPNEVTHNGTSRNLQLFDTDPSGTCYKPTTAVMTVRLHILTLMKTGWMVSRISTAARLNTIRMCVVSTRKKHKHTLSLSVCGFSF